METDKIIGENSESKNQETGIVHFPKGMIFRSPLELLPINYVTRVTKKMNEIDFLKPLKSNVSVIDYIVMYNLNDLESLKKIKDLRDIIDNVTNLKEKRKFEKELSFYEPKDKAKYAILVETIQHIADMVDMGIGYGIAFNYYWNGHFWDIMPTEIMKELLITLAIKSGFKPFDIKIADRIDLLYKQFTTSAVIPNPTLDLKNVCINLKNGIFVISEVKQELIPHNRDYFFKYELPFNYDPNAKAEKWRTFLNEVLPEIESQMVLAEYLGYVFTKNIPMEECVVLVGSGSNGKSVVYRIIKALLGKENISSYTLAELCKETGYYRVNLVNKLLNYAPELSGKGCNPDTVKSLISTEPVSARSPYGDAFEIENYCKFMFNTNLIPKDIEHTHAYFRRFIYIDFKVKIAKEKRDKTLAKKIIKDELSGIFNWIIEGLKRFIENDNKFTFSQKIEDALLRIETETNSVAAFIDNFNYIPSVTNKVTLKDLYTSYCTYCKESNNIPVSMIEFSRRLTELNFVIKRKETNNTTNVYCEIKSDITAKKSFDDTKSAIFKMFPHLENKDSEIV